MARRKQYNRYDEDFKATAVALTKIPGIQAKDVAEALAIHPVMLYRWCINVSYFQRRVVSNMIQKFINSLVVLNIFGLIFLYFDYRNISSDLENIKIQQTGIRKHIAEYANRIDHDISYIREKMNSVEHKINRIEFESRGYLSPDSNASIEFVPADREQTDTSFHSDRMYRYSTNKRADKSICDAVINGGLATALFGLSGLYAEKCQ